MYTAALALARRSFCAADGHLQQSYCRQLYAFVGDTKNYQVPPGYYVSFFREAFGQTVRISGFTFYVPGT